MTISAAFTIDGTAVPGEVETTFGSSVALALTSTTGVLSVEWAIIGLSANLTTAPTVTYAGTPSGATASFTADADQGDGQGVGYAIRCTVSDGKNTATSYGVVGVPASYGRVPPIANERLARDATQGWLGLFADMASGFPHTAGQFTTTSAVTATAATVAIPTGQIVKIMASWSGVDAVTGDRLMRESTAYFQNDAGTVTQKGSTVDTINHEDDISWYTAFVISGTDVTVRYQGDATNSVDWRITAWTFTPGN